MVPDDRLILLILAKHSNMAKIASRHGVTCRIFDEYVCTIDGGELHEEIPKHTWTRLDPAMEVDMQR